ncbi:MAG: exodeoxyribonuclease VII small subunit [Marinilabiliaceae bacterium]|nr:exodeoxyribonuclease VII small subunit [Marinilabiliaceae bacterium]
MGETKKSSFSYDEAIKQVERIIEKLQNPDQVSSVDAMLADVEKATKLLKSCQDYVSDTQKKVVKLLEKDA